jgi:hypothetical protein
VFHRVESRPLLAGSAFIAISADDMRTLSTLVVLVLMCSRGSIDNPVDAWHCVD